MRVNPYTQSSTTSWLKWALLAICLVLVACFIYAAFLYHHIQESKQAGFSETKDRVLKNTELTEIEHLSRFQGKTGYHIVFGSTKDHREEMVFVPVNHRKDSEKVTIINTKDIINKQNITRQWKSQCNQCELVKITPAMVDKKPLWEVTYKDNADRYVMDYLSIYDGERFQQLRFKSMFN